MNYNMNIQLTLDYELFLGDKTGTVSKCLIEPLDALNRVLCKKDVKLTLFVDCAYLLKMQKMAVNDSSINQDYRTVCKHLETLGKDGHELQFHFHPQWLYSDYSNNVWKMDLDHYKLSDMDEEFLRTSFSEALSILRNIASNDVCAFRAGGYSIQTYSHIKELFKSNGIRMDSSVMPGGVILEEKHFYDFRKAPRKGRWRFSEDVIKEEEDGPFIELPITTNVPLTNIHYLLKKRILSKSHAGNHIWGDGRSIDLAGSTANRIKDKISKLLRPCIFVASIDNVMSENLQDMYDSNKNEYFTVIGHPKNFTKKSIQNVESFIDITCNNAMFSTVSSCIK